MKKGILVLAAMITISFGAFAQKYGHIDAQVLLTELPDYKLAEDSIEKFAKQLEAEIKDMYRIYEERVADFEKGKAAGMPPAIEQSRMQELQQKQQMIQQFQASAQTDIQAREGSLLEPMVKKVKEAIDKVAMDNKYTYVFDANILLFHAGGDDISPLVRKELGLIE
jgi:outer membrane protein